MHFMAYAGRGHAIVEAGEFDMQYRNDKNGTPLSVLGFGCMRFTKKGHAIDIYTAQKEILTA